MGPGWGRKRLLRPCQAGSGSSAAHASSQGWMGGWLVSRCCARGSVSPCWVTRALFLKTRDGGGGVRRGRVKGVVAKQGWGEICALMSETEYLASSVSLFLAQWACQRSGGLCWDVISTSAVYQNLLKSTTQACHSAQEFPGNMYCTRAGKHSETLLSCTRGRKSKHVRGIRCFS